MIIAVNFQFTQYGKKKPEKNQGFNGIRGKKKLLLKLLKLENLLL